MKAQITWRYFLVPKDKFAQVSGLAIELDGLRNRELNEEEAARKEALIEELNQKAAAVALKVKEYQDSDQDKDGTIIEELVYRMDESREVKKYSSGFYFQFLVHASPDDIQSQKAQIEKIFHIIESQDLLKKEFLGKWEYLERARALFLEIKELFHFAFENNCGIFKTDQVTWLETPEDQAQENGEEEE
jgi:hypothetical protein